jgi:hypothetical protein
VLAQHVDDKIELGTDNQYEHNALGAKILELVQRDVSEKQVLKLDEALIDFINKEAKSQGISDLRRAVLQLVDSDMQNAEVIDLYQRFAHHRDHSTENIFLSQKLAQAVNALNHDLNIFDKRASVGFSFVETIQYPAGIGPVRQLRFPARKDRNDVYVDCVFAFNTASRPVGIDFHLGNDQDAFESMPVHHAEKTIPFDFTIPSDKLPDLPTTEGHMQTLKMIISPETSVLEGEVHANDKARPAPQGITELESTCFVLIIGDLPLQANKNKLQGKVAAQ